MTNIAILGFGVVGSGVAEVIAKNSGEFADKHAVEQINIKHILDLREFPDHPLSDRVTSDFNKILNDDEVTIVVETMGGSHPAYDFSKQALLAGKSVVTSNKEVVANFGAELIDIARNNGVSYLFEASVGGGIPIIRPMWQCLVANIVDEIAGILNGTCNYILTKMEKEMTDFATALSQAQELGYAERNPAADVEGTDTCRKISILTSLAFGKHVYPDNVLCEGITKITYDDIAYARRNGYAIKLLGISKKASDGKVYALTAPHFVPVSNSISGVNDVYNGILVEGNVVQDVLFCGRGAGSLPTASAVTADVLDVIMNPGKIIGWKNEEADFLGDISENETRAYVRTTADISVIKDIFGTNDIDEVGDANVFFTSKMKEKEMDEKLSNLGAEYIKIRVLD